LNCHYVNAALGFAIPCPFVGSARVNTIELAASYSIVASSFPLPPCGGGLGWGVWRQRIGSDAVAEAGPPPTLALPHEGGGDQKAFWTSVFLTIQRDWG
jgi:hypothetical protein